MTNFISTFWGSKYNKEYVQKLHNAISRNYHGEFKFYCQTDQELNIPGVIEVPFTHFYPINTGRFPDKPKLNLFEPGIWGLSGRKVYFDLDVVILKNLQPLLEVYENKPVINKSWWQEDEGVNDDPINHLAYRGITNGSVYIWEDSEYTQSIWDHIKKNSKYIFHQAINGSDGYYSSIHLNKFDFVPRTMTMSYYNQAKNDDAIICTIDTKINHPLYGTQKELHEIEDSWILDNWT